MVTRSLASGLIDDKGRLIPTRENPLGRAWDDLNYLVYDRGFVYVNVSFGRELVTIWLNPHRMQQIGLPTLYFLLADYRPKKVMLIYGSEFGQHVVVRSDFYAAILAIGSITEDAGTGTTALEPVVQWRRRSLVTARHTGDPKTIVSALYERNGIWDADLYSKLRSAGVLDHAAVIQSESEQTLRIEHWGRKRDVLGQRWIHVASGLKVEEQPFKRVGSRIARLYRQALADNQPRLHDIESTLPASDGMIVRRRFTRLVLPYTSYILNITIPHASAE